MKYDQLGHLSVLPSECINIVRVVLLFKIVWWEIITLLRVVPDVWRHLPKKFFFYTRILLTVHLVMILGKWPTWRTILFYVFISILYIFPATPFSSSGASIVSIQPLVHITLCRWPLRVQVGKELLFLSESSWWPVRPPGTLVESDSTIGCMYTTVSSWRWALGAQNM